MKLGDLCETFEVLPFPRAGERAHPERGIVADARSAVAKAVIDDEFLVDCISWELRLIESRKLRRGLLPFFTLPGFGVRFAFGYWPPGGTPGPHEHTAWTITAVCRNELEVWTYDRQESYRKRELVPKNHFSAPAGKVGYIFEPCIHEPRNTSQDWSLSLHVISPRDGEPLSDCGEALAALNYNSRSIPLDEREPYTAVIVERQRQRCIRQLSRILTRINAPGARSLLATCYSLASSGTQKQIAAAQEHKAQSKWLLMRSHDDLVLKCRFKNGLVFLDSETVNGPIEEFGINDVAANAVEVIAKERIIDVSTLPGELSDDERTAIGELLEDGGLFKRVEL